MSKSWDNGILKKLKALVGRGLSTAEIGKKLGISKNAVVGKLHRLGWNAAANDAPNKSAVGKKSVSESKKIVPKKPVIKVTKPANRPTKVSPKKVEKMAKAQSVTPEKPKRISVRGTTKESAVHQRMVQHALEMANLKPNQCRWPIGDPDSEGFHFCGQPVFVGKPYCYEHCKQAYQFTAPKKK